MMENTSHFEFALIIIMIDAVPQLCIVLLRDTSFLTR